MKSFIVDDKFYISAFDEKTGTYIFWCGRHHGWSYAHWLAKPYKSAATANRAILQVRSGTGRGSEFWAEAKYSNGAELLGWARTGIWMGYE